MSPDDHAEHDADNLVRQRAADLIADARHQLDEAVRLLYEGDAAVASALAVRLPRAVELMDVSGVMLTAARLRAEHSAYRRPPGVTP